MTLSIGVDLAQARDRTTIAAVESYSVAEERDGKARKARHLTLSHLDRLAPGLPYPAQAELIVASAERFASHASDTPVLWVDATGVGRPVVDLIRQSSPFTVRAVTLTAGNDVTPHGTAVSVPKVELVAALEVALSTRRLHASPDLAFADDLDRELRAFSYSLSPAGRPLYEGVGAHDDFVIALALAVFGAEHGGFRTFLAALAEAQAR